MKVNIGFPVVWTDGGRSVGVRSRELRVRSRKIHSLRDSVRKARESHLIDKAMTLEPHGLNSRDELLESISLVFFLSSF